MLRSARIARLLDARFRMPVVGLRFGWDSILGLLPVVGDSVTLLAGCAVLIEARSLRAPWRVMLPMAGNLLVDYLIGLVPIVGDIFDAYYKANLRNVALLERWLATRGPSRPARGPRPARAAI